MGDERRRYETGDKFWEIWVDEGQIYTHFGALGSNGQTKLKATSNPDSDVEDMIVKKKKEGYKQTGGPKVAQGPALDAKALKKHIAAITDDPATAVPLADWLQGQQHPWGELIALQVAAATTPKKKASLEKEANKLLEQKGDAIFPALSEDGTSATWKAGFVDRGQIGSDADPKALLAAAKSFLASPAAARIQEVVFAPVPRSFPVWQDWGDTGAHIVNAWTEFDKVAALVPKHVTKVGFGPWPAVAASAYSTLPTGTQISKAFPELTELSLIGTLPDKFGKLSLPKLTSLTVRLAEGSEANLTALAGSKLPKLEKLELGIGGLVYALVDEVHEPEEYDYDEDDEDDEDDQSRYPATFSAADLEKMVGYDRPQNDRGAHAVSVFMAAKWPATLKHLGLSSSALVTDVLADIFKSPLVKQLTSLDLSNTQLTDEAAKPILAAAKKLAHLESLDLSRNAFSDKSAKEIQKALPNAKVAGAGKPKKDQSLKPDRIDFFFRYSATME
ncbi:MAG: hypothetical protein QM831_14980 [Kofleriaceae bacterium]